MKTTKMSTIVVLALGLMVWLNTDSKAAPLGTAFTYQGRLMDTNIPANGLYDLQFKIYDHADPCSGVEVAPPVLLEDVEILDGYFTVDVDFGEGVFMGDARWLGVGARPWDSEEPLEDFGDPQPMGPAPHATYADNAGKLNGKLYTEFANVDMTGTSGFLPKYASSFQLTKSAIYEQSGNVCIGAVGTTQDKLDVWGDIRIRGGNIKDNAGRIRITMYSAGDMSLRDSAGAEVFRISQNSNVGINTGSGSILQQDLEIKGGVFIDHSGSNNPLGDARVAFVVDGKENNDIMHLRDYDSDIKVVVKKDGKVGIGTTEPEQTLEVEGGVYIDLSESHWPVDNPNVALTVNGGWDEYLTPFDIAHFRDANGVIRVKIDGKGNLAVGSWDPDFLDMNSPTVDVGGTIRVKGPAEFEASLDIGGSVDVNDGADIDGSFNANGPVTFTNLAFGGGETVVVDPEGTLFKVGSSERYKTNIENLETNPDMVLQLQPVRFQWKTTGHRDIGLIAEEVAQLSEDLVIYDKQGRPDAVKYDKVSLYLLETVKELKAENDLLKQRLDALEKTIAQQHINSVKGDARWY